MESEKDLGVNRAKRTDMAPLTWDRNTPQPGTLDLDTPDGTEQTPMFETADLEGFGDDTEGERTVITAATPYDLRPKFTGRTTALQQLTQLTDKAFTEKEIAFAVVVGEPGMGKSRIIGEAIARAKTKIPNVHVLQGVADENAHAYGPIARGLTVRFGLQPGEDPAESRDKIQAGVAEVA